MAVSGSAFGSVRLSGSAAVRGSAVVYSSAAVCANVRQYGNICSVCAQQCMRSVCAQQCVALGGRAVARQCAAVREKQTLKKDTVCSRAAVR